MTDAEFLDKLWADAQAGYGWSLVQTTHGEVQRLRVLVFGAAVIPASRVPPEVVLELAPAQIMGYVSKARARLVDEVKARLLK